MQETMKQTQLAVQSVQVQQQVLQQATTTAIAELQRQLLQNFADIKAEVKGLSRCAQELKNRAEPASEVQQTLWNLPCMHVM
mmetsp:Transcript_34586/g.87482  ORF Transcript_34586/g.87482 Transcript_34586/m.87482 type:complete len:82 (+) Transcript_34586:339-584(+)